MQEMCPVLHSGVDRFLLIKDTKGCSTVLKVHLITV